MASLLSAAHAPGSTAAQHPLAPDYRIDVSTIANDCEFYVKLFGDAVDGWGERWLEAEIVVNRQLEGKGRGEVLNAGAWVNYLVDAKGKQQSVIVLGERRADDFLVTIPYRDYSPSQEGYRKIEHYNVFVDVRREDGKVYRYWHRSRDTVLSPETTFYTYPHYSRERGHGSITYTQSPSPIYDLRNRCE